MSAELTVLVKAALCRRRKGVCATEFSDMHVGLGQRRYDWDCDRGAGHDEHVSRLVRRRYRAVHVSCIAGGSPATPPATEPVSEKVVAPKGRDVGPLPGLIPPSSPSLSYPLPFRTRRPPFSVPPSFQNSLLSN